MSSKKSVTITLPRADLNVFAETLVSFVSGVATVPEGTSPLGAVSIWEKARGTFIKKGVAAERRLGSREPLADLRRSYASTKRAMDGDVKILKRLAEAMA